MSSDKMSSNVWIYFKVLSISLSMAGNALAGAISVWTVENAFGHVLKTTLETFDSISCFEILHRDDLSISKWSWSIMETIKHVFVI